MNSGDMAPSTQSTFSDSLERSARLQEVQRWKAAQTVRASVGADAGLDSILECLDLTDAQCPEQI